MKLLILIFFASILTLNASIDTVRYKSYRAGLTVGYNYNNAGLGNQNLTVEGNNFAPLVVRDGGGIGSYIGLFGEYKSDSWWGAALRLSYDDRFSDVKDNTTNPDRKLALKVSYLNIEPLFIFQPEFIDNLNIFLGPQFLINLSSKYDYTPPDGTPTQENLEITKMNSFIWGLAAGFSYDIHLFNINNQNSVVASPFAEGSWIFNQRDAKLNDRQSSLTDIWTTVSLRFGIRACIDFSNKMPDNEISQLKYVSISVPKGGIIRSRSIDEYFPLLPYIFFDKASQEIPTRYVLSEDYLKKTSRKSQKKNGEYPNNQMYVYYNIFNIFASRMYENSLATLTLIGSSKDEKEAKVMADNVKNYLVDYLHIDKSRITTKAQKLPRKPTTINDSTENMELAEIENRRVEFFFSDIKAHYPVRLQGVEETSFENDIIFSIDPDAKIKSWSIIVDNNSKEFIYGPYYNDLQRINPAEIMKGMAEGNFHFKVKLITDDNKEIFEGKEIYLKKKTMPENNISKRYTILYDYKQTETKKSDIDYINSEVTPNIDERYSIVIHGHTDDIGKEDINLNVSKKRAEDIKKILDSELLKSNNKVGFQIFGLGEDLLHTFFDNSTPEGRHYNRSVVIDIIPLGE